MCLSRCCREASPGRPRRTEGVVNPFHPQMQAPINNKSSGWPTARMGHFFGWDGGGKRVQEARRRGWRQCNGTVKWIRRLQVRYPFGHRRGKRLGKEGPSAIVRSTTAEGCLVCRPAQGTHPLLPQRSCIVAHRRGMPPPPPPRLSLEASLYDAGIVGPACTSTERWPVAVVQQSG